LWPLFLFFDKLVLLKEEYFMNVLKRNNVKVSGQGQPIIFAHGFGCDQNMWRYVTGEFKDEFQVILFDHVGAGLSDAAAYDTQKYSSLNGYADDVLEICLALGLKDVIYVGHSVSAMIGVLAALKQPKQFKKLFLVGPSPCYINQGEYSGGFDRKDIEELLESLDSNYLGWSANMAPVIMGNPEQPELGEELKNSFCRTNPEIAKHFARVTFLSDNRKDLPNLQVPAVVLQCSEDLIAPLSVGEFVHQQIPQADFYQMNATGHCPNLSAPEETIQAIKAHL
jgi:sigma-B regulation protein RsbQ